MFRGIIVLVLTALAAFANVRLYLKEGEYQLVREYQVKGDRVRYYSIERGDWEEIPLELVNLAKTEAEAKRRDESMKEEAAALAVEEKAEREVRKEVERVPQEPGVYLIDGAQLKTIKAAESKFTGGTRKRAILKVLSPIPMVSGKGTLEIDGAHSENIVPSDRPEFYFRLSTEERFGIVKLGEHKGNRVVEQLTIVPVTKEVVEEQTEVKVFRQQAGDLLYKVWPMKPLEPGEYALVEYTPATDGNLHVQVWDFGVRTNSAPAAPLAK